MNDVLPERFNNSLKPTDIFDDIRNNSRRISYSQAFDTITVNGRRARYVLDREWTVITIMLRVKEENMYWNKALKKYNRKKQQFMANNDPRIREIKSRFRKEVVNKHKR